MMRARFALTAALVALAACSGGGPSGRPAPVAPLPAPSLPPWIASISPQKTAGTLAQIRVIFAQPVAAVGSLEGDGPRAVLAHFTVTPALPGRFVLFTPKMVGFVAERPLPRGMRVRVTIAAGLADLSGDALDADLAWTFQTAPLTLSGLSGGDPKAPSPAPTGLDPVLRVDADAPVDLASLAAHATLSGGGRTVPLDARADAQATTSDTYAYDLAPRGELAKATTYALRIAPGVFASGGNLPTAVAYTGKVVTYGPFAIVPGTARGGDGGRFAGGDPQIAFTNPVDPAALAGNVAVAPASQHPPAFKVAEFDPSRVAIDPFQLGPHQTYTITFGPKVADTFGQTLGTSRSVTVRTPGFAPGLWAPSGTNVFPTGSGVSLNVYATDLPGDAYRARFVALDPPGARYFENAYGAMGDPSTWTQRTIAGAKPDVQSVVKVPVADLLGAPTGALAYGVSVTTGAYPTTYAGVVQLTDLGVFAQIFPDRASVAVQRLSDGAPVPSADIRFYRLADDGTTQRCASGTTGADGTLDLVGDALAPCYTGARPADVAPQVAVVASSGDDWASARIHSWDAFYGDGLDGGWTDGTPLSRGTIFSDRQMYRPGESVRLTGVAYYVRSDAIVAGAGAAYALQLIDPSGAKTSLGSLNADAHGVFSLVVPLAQTQALGYYTVQATGDAGDVVFGSFRVAEFKPPNFKLDLSLSAPVAVAGSSVAADAKGAYLFGAPLAGARAKIAVARDVAYLAPKGLDDYTFGRKWFWPDQQPSFDTDVLQAEGTFDGGGAWSRKVAVPADLPFPMTYAVDVTASDVTNASVDATQTFTALASDVAIGLKTGLVAKAGEPMRVDVVAAGLDGKLASGRDVRLVLQKMTYGSATRIDGGAESAENGVQYATVETVDVTTADRAVAAVLHPKESGPYRVRANFAGAKGDASATDFQAYVVGSGDVDWGADDPNVVRIALDKKSYKVGETATALIAAPYAKSDVYVAVVRDDVIWKTVVHATGNGPRISFTVTPAMVPNAAIEALVVRRGAPVKPGAAGAPDSLARIGVAGFVTDVRDRYLKVAIRPQSRSLDPGARQSIALSVTDAAGKPARSEAIVVVADEAILQLTGYRLPDLVQTVYADQPISVRYADSRRDVVLRTQTPFAEKGWGYGGGFLAGAGSTRVRTDFRPLAYYRIVETDAQGKAEVGFLLPDDLTTWRAMVVAIGDDDRRFGTDDATFIATKPLLAEPVLPQFARPGDIIDAGMSALDATGTGGTLTYDGTLTGSLSFLSGDARRISGSEGIGAQMAALRFPMAVGTPAPTEVGFAAALGDLRDAFRVPFAVRDAAVTEAVVESGATASTARVPLDPSAGGTVAVSLSNSAVTQVAVPAEAAMRADPQPFLDDAAGRVAIATATLALAPRYRLEPGYDATTARDDGLAAIAKLQRADGGFGAYGDADESDPYASAVAVGALADARTAGARVPAGALTRAKAYLARTLADPSRYRWCTGSACRARVRFAMLEALAALGDRRSDFLSDVVAAEPSFDAATQIRVARYLLRVPGWETRGAALADSLEQSVYRTGRYATAAVDAQAQMLLLLVQRGAAATETDGAVRALAAQSCGCGYRTVSDAAEAMTAIARYAAGEKIVPFDATVSGAGMPAETVQLGTDVSSQTVVVDATKMKKGALAFSVRGGGTLHYVVLYTYPVKPDAPGALAGLRVTRTVVPAGRPGPVATMDLAAIAKPLDAPVGGVYDVGVRIVVDHPVDGVAIEDPLPAGMEAVDETLKTAPTAIALSPSDSWAIAERQIYADRVFGYAAHLDPGIYEMHYLARTVTPGTYRWPGARAYLRAAPEEFGRTASAVLQLHR